MNDSQPTARPTDRAWENLCAQVTHFAADEANRDQVAQLLAGLLRPYCHPPLYQKYFRFWEQHGFHLTPVHFYQPVPDTRTLPDSLWKKASAMRGIDLNEATQLQLLRESFPKFRDEYSRFPRAATGEPHEFYLDNGRFSGTDALVLYCMVRHLQPRRVIEVGSGFSSLITAQAARRNGNTELVCIEPYPEELLQKGFPGLTQLLPQKVEEIAPEYFEELQANDILFIDSSHVVKIGGDVNYLFFEILPRLKPGVVVHVHDIFLPNEYRRDWVMDEFRFWTEQYLLQAFLMFNSDWEVLFANSFMAQKHLAEFQATFPDSPWWGGGSFWMRRK